jgi:hypothetical protein
MRRGIITLGLVASMAVSSAAGAAELEPGGTFVDDDGSVHEGSIEAIAAAGITRSCNPPVGDRFCPSDAVTRGQMAAFLVRALELPEASGDSFTDDDDSEFEGDIERLAAAGITRGCSPTAFCPDDPITRGQMAAFLVRAYGYPPSDEDPFVDDDDSIFESDINALAASGITVGCGEGLFCPDDRVNRDQMATFITRAEGLTPIIPPARPEIRLVEVAAGLNTPVHATAPAGDDRLFIVQKSGVISILEGGSVLAEPFLDISARVDDSGNEMGLLSMAFHPQYSENGRFFVYYSRAGGPRTIRASSPNTRSPSDPDVAEPTDATRSSSSPSRLLEPQRGPSSCSARMACSTSSLGDGGGGGDPVRQRTGSSDTLLGSILRIDVAIPGTYVRHPRHNPYVGTQGSRRDMGDRAAQSVADLVRRRSAVRGRCRSRPTRGDLGRRSR